MHYNKLNGNLFTTEHLKCIEVDKISPNHTDQKNFVHGLQNARKLLDGLERSIRKTSKYEDQLLRCKGTHVHSHDWWNSGSNNGFSDRECGSLSETTQPRGQVNLSESWSTISIVCLQYQYEELSKKYTSLLRAYHESCNSTRGREAALARLRAHTRRALAQLALAHRTLIAVGDKYLALRRKKLVQLSYHESCNSTRGREAPLARLRAHTRRALAQLALAHRTLLAVGDKYMALRRKKLVQKNRYECRIKRLEATVRGVMAMCEHARLQLDTRLMRYMQTERDAPNAHLLAEIRKCNLLFLENLRLKAQIEELSPGKVFAEEQ